ncbi:hypothetical protein MTR67_039108 [Solanum verrucosum]|uniref:Uncharacterized protein n=1 Tax=Solanum verrucosum TaxID=315347 RepID=A0AAF0ZQ37_SOLVR|nr:hypothetical protein MTR67_039108 [Solanum verrucosum]
MPTQGELGVTRDPRSRVTSTAQLCLLHQRISIAAGHQRGKGRGRGLKSLGEKGNTPSKSLLPQSSDLVKKYINEIETSSTEKDKGQGLKRSTIFTCQGMQTIYKNSMVPEKENKQINLSFPTFAIKVEKCTQEVEKSSMEKDRGQGLKKSTIFTSQGMQTIYKNSTVEKCTQEVETSFVDVFGYHMTKTKLYVFCPTFVHSSVNYSLEDAPTHSYFAMNVMQNLGCYLSFLVS